MLKIIADENMPALDETFAAGNELIRVNGRQISRQHVKDADVLLVRSVTPVNAALLESSKVRFVGSATIGIDHLDCQWMTANNIEWANAPGCNADAAAQYTLAMMLLACERLKQDFWQQSVGVIGRGNVGSRLVHLLESLELPVVACDPPLQAMGQANLVSMQEACSQSIVSLHIPLTLAGPCPTQHLFNQQTLSQLPAGTLLVNAARGGVVDASALLPELERKRLHAALDVWPDEPCIDRKLLDRVEVATPHVAGSSVQGKRNGTYMIYRAFRASFPDLKHTPCIQTMRNPGAGILDFSVADSLQEVLQQLIRSSCPVARDDQALRALRDRCCNGQGVQIDALRNHYPRRFEFASWAYRGVASPIANTLKKLGFSSA